MCVQLQVQCPLESISHSDACSSKVLTTYNILGQRTVATEFNHNLDDLEGNKSAAMKWIFVSGTSISDIVSTGTRTGDDIEEAEK